MLWKGKEGIGLTFLNLQLLFLGIKSNGEITNKLRGQKLLAKVVINGREQIVRNGEIISGFEVVGITNDQISLKSPEKEVKRFGR
jgi:hypothetical protein